MNRPAFSKHLRRLHQVGLLANRKEGAASICTLNARPLRLMDDWLSDYQRFWSESLRV
jgi:hypothetical protein